ncbi:hypothetical protein NYE27_21175 [Paenibacillus sp. FSL R10-2779]|uniref:hypothetical protein n=1 Tax=Paenibacillus sp. FSL R10-2779 TaxID=2975340 RepID=UPI0030FCD154
MADVEYLYFYIEHYVKTEVDYDQLSKLSAESFDKFLTKAAIQVSRSTSPKLLYNLSRGDVRELIYAIMYDIRLSGKRFVAPERDRMYSFINNVGEPIYIHAKSKKEASERWKRASHTSPKYWGGGKTLRKVVGFSDEGMLLLDNGETRDLTSDLNVVNLYGYGGKTNE